MCVRVCVCVCVRVCLCVCVCECVCLFVCAFCYRVSLILTETARTTPSNSVLVNLPENITVIGQVKYWQACVTI